MHSVARQIGTNLFSVREIPAADHVTQLTVTTGRMWAPVPEPTATATRAALRAVGRPFRAVVARGRPVPVAGLFELPDDVMDFFTAGC